MIILKSTIYFRYPSEKEKNCINKYFIWNQEHKNDGLYEDRAIFSPNVNFGFTKANVITCAPPNIVHEASCELPNDKNAEALINRLTFIKKIAEDNNVKTLILSPFGCEKTEFFPSLRRSPQIEVDGKVYTYIAQNSLEVAAFIIMEK